MVLICTLHSAMMWKHCQGNRKYSVITKRLLQFRVPSRPELEPDAMEWLDQNCKTEEYHLNVAALLVILPAHYLIMEILKLETNHHKIRLMLNVHHKKSRQLYIGYIIVKGLR